MQKREPIQQRPPYPIESVDNALRILQMLRDEGTVRLTDIAAELDIAISTAHRLMAMLVYRGFALQDDSRRYVAGPALGERAIGGSWTRTLRRLSMNSLEVLSGQLNETVNLLVRVGVSVRFLATVEGSATLRVGDRGGAVLPARLASGGKVLLAYEPPERLERLYRSRGVLASGHGLSEAEFEELRAELALVRTRGYAINNEYTEAGVAALGVAIIDPSGRPVASFSVSVPATRIATLQSRTHLAAAFAARDDIQAVLAAEGFSAG